MTRSQKKALDDYCEEFGYSTKEVVKALKASGAIDDDAKAEDLGDYINGTSYDDMLSFLNDNI